MSSDVKINDRNSIISKFVVLIALGLLFGHYIKIKSEAKKESFEQLSQTEYTNNF